MMWCMSKSEEKNSARPDRNILIHPVFHRKARNEALAVTLFGDGKEKRVDYVLGGGRIGA